MANLVQISVGDASPQISYYPFGDTLSSPDLSAGWNPYFSLSGFAAALGDTGNGTGYHITSLDGASLSIHWRGTGIQLQGNATNASYSLLLDGAVIQPDIADPEKSILATIQGLPDADHTISLTTQIPVNQDPPNSSIVVFDQAIIISPITNDTSPDEKFTLRSLNDNDIAYLGQWSYQNGSGFSFHQSNTVGDRALATFNGTSFLLKGTTSPSSGNYTVTLDNISTSLSGASSFTAHNTLLYFASGLDPNSNHSVEIRNDGGGSLALLAGGFSVYATGAVLNDSIETPTSSNISASFPRGTIAAFALAGILAFLGISGLLFFFLVYRPRRRRRRLSRAAFRFRQRPPSSYKEHEAVLDIGPHGSGDDDGSMEMLDVPNDLGRRDSSKSGFSRWKEIDGVVPTAGGMGVDFRHSDSYMKGKEGYENAKYDDELAFEESYPLSARSSLFTNSSRKGRRSLRNKGKAKRGTDESWSPSFTLELPLQGPHTTPESGRSSMPGHGVESLSYMSPRKSSASESPHNPPPPSYAASMSNRASNKSSQPSVPRSISRSRSTDSAPGLIPKVPTRESSTGNLEEPNPRPTESDTISPPLPVYYPLESLSKEDRGSIIGSSADDHQNMIAGPMVRQVIRSLSPRTSELETSTPPQHQLDWMHEKKGKARNEASGEQQEPSSSSSQEPTKAKTRKKRGTKGSRPSTATKTLEVRDSAFLTVPETSPFRVDFAEGSLVIPRRSSAVPGVSTSARDSSLSPLRLDPERTADEGSSSTREQQQPEESPTREHQQLEVSPAIISRQPFRLTPASIPPPTLGYSSPSGSIMAESFLDLSSSSDHSLRRISSTSRERHRDSSPLPEALPGERSRWSNTTMSTSHDRMTGSPFFQPPALPAPRPGAAPVHIPFLVTIPSNSSVASLGGDNVDVGSNDQSSNDQRQSHLSVASQQPSDALHVHPYVDSLESPTGESVRMSFTSDLRFRHSGSHDSRRASSFSAPFGREHGYAAFPPDLAERVGTFSPALSTPGYIVQRVLGIHSPTSSVGGRPGHSRSGSGGVGQFNPAQPTGRHDFRDSDDRFNSGSER